MRTMQCRKLAFHALRGSHIVHPADGNIVGYGRRILVIVIRSVGRIDPSGPQIVDAGGVVVAVMTASDIKRTSLVETAPGGIDAVDVPCERLTESSLAVETAEMQSPVVLFTAVSMHQHTPEKHAVGIFVAVKHPYNPRYAVGGKPVVAVETRHYVARAEFESLVACYGRTLVAVKTHCPDAVIERRPTVHNVGRGVCRAVVNAHDLNLRIGLTGKRLQASVQVFLSVVHGNKHAYLSHATAF